MQRFIKFLVVGGTGFIVQVIAQELSIVIGLTLFLAVLLDNLLPNKIDTPLFSHALGAGFGAEFAIISNFIFNNFVVGLIAQLVRASRYNIGWVSGSGIRSLYI